MLRYFTILRVSQAWLREFTTTFQIDQRKITMKNTIMDKVTTATVVVMTSIPAFAQLDPSGCVSESCTTNVAEPGSIALLGAGIAAIAVSRYFKSRNK